MVYTFTAFPYVSDSYLGISPYAFLGLNLFFYLKCCYTNPGVITHKKVAFYVAAFPYDGVMYKKDNTCKTCLVIKPARSKHCGNFLI